MIFPNDPILIDEFIKQGISRDDSHKLFNSGYYIAADGHIADSFYGNKYYSGLHPLNSSGVKFSPKEFTVSSLSEIKSILSEPEHAVYRSRMVFRGQTKEYYTQREYPNPIAEHKGKERLIIPGYWRKFSTNWNLRFSAPDYESVFLSNYGDELIYHGIANWRNLASINSSRYGPHLLSDLENFPDPESQEYGRRWQAFKIQGIANTSLPLVEQHYGIETTGLDVTFDVSIATFFSLHQFTKRHDDTAYYQPIDPLLHAGIVYCIVFESPPLTRATQNYLNNEIFSHIKPTRPVSQDCALPFFGRHNINEAVADLLCIFKIAPNFSTDDIPNSNDLFPEIYKDPFYKAALEAKFKAMKSSPLKNIVEYSL
ncbi:hypothetical protein [Solidesulfovibrio magneticus]|uniref:FRG domain-containing protein n=1 Tax=Solidesulfovibrio magneticus (strain ATCC 700980 / DSM 13731 / RS-1) TaxID=573370 RepID=C4XTH4_SOLM1|nr:hypothetical protein [Solidesulfovibrio magneticus]BAH75971.1 hypothetical protein DMR_24800 [Solidesulfovibrio magneticus RS-1]